MKELILPIIALVALTSFAEAIRWDEVQPTDDSSSIEGATISDVFELNDPNKTVFTTLKSDGSTNTWTQADLVQALGLLNRKYHRDCESSTGRRAWHGKLSKEVVNTNDQTKTEVYADGTSFTYKFKVVTPAMAVSNANKRVIVSTNGIPAKLAAARLRRQQEKATTNVVNQVLKVN